MKSPGRGIVPGPAVSGARAAWVADAIDPKRLEEIRADARAAAAEIMRDWEGKKSRRKVRIPREPVESPSPLGDTPRCDERKDIVPHSGDIALPQPGSAQDPRAGRLATVNSLKPDAVGIRARSARGGEAAVSLLEGRDETGAA